MNYGSFEKGVAICAAASKERSAPLRGTHENGGFGGFGLRAGFWEARKGRSRRRQSAAIRFDAADRPRELLGEVVCGAPAATAVVVPGFLAQMIRFEPEAVRKATETPASGSCRSHMLPVPIFLRSEVVIMKSRARFELSMTRPAAT
jgi:hypothetical protein